MADSSSNAHQPSAAAAAAAAAHGSGVVDKAHLNEYYFTVQLVESQRRFVLTGWTGRARFPVDPYEWSDPKGQCSRTMREVDFELPKGPPYPCEWAGDWEIYCGTDEEDWLKGGDPYKNKKNSRGSSPLTRSGSGGNNSNSAGFGKGDSASSTPATSPSAAGGASDAVATSGDDDGSAVAPLKYTRFDDDGWEYAFDYHSRGFKNKQSSTMSWVRRRFWRRMFVVRAPSVEEAEDEIDFPDRFRICLLDGPTDRAKHLAACADYLVYRPQPRVSDYKVGLARIGLNLYKPADGDHPRARSRSRSADKQQKNDQQ